LRVSRRRSFLQATGSLPAESILLAVPAGIGMVVNRVIMEVNPRVCDILGYRREELVGQNSCMLYLSDEDYNYVGKEKYRQIAGQGSGTVETRFRCKDGRIIFASRDRH